MCVICSTIVPTLFQYFFTITSLHSFTFFMKCFLVLVIIVFMRSKEFLNVQEITVII